MLQRPSHYAIEAVHRLKEALALADYSDTITQHVRCGHKNRELWTIFFHLPEGFTPQVNTSNHLDLEEPQVTFKVRMVFIVTAAFTMHWAISLLPLLLLGFLGVVFFPFY